MTDAAAPSSAQPAPRARLGRLGLLLAALAALTAAGGAAWWLTGAAPPPWWPGAASRSAAISDPVFVPLEPFTVNLQPQGRARFLHVAVTLKVPDAKGQALLVKYLPEVRSRVLTVLANREADALLLPEEKSRLGQEIQQSLQAPLAAGLPAQVISAVMFTTFMLQ